MNNLNEQVSKNYEKFFAKFSKINDLPINEWDKTLILAYICKRYKDYYNLDFTFSFKGPPSKCRESFEISKLTQQLSSDPIILKDYIDWVFDTKIIQRKKRVTSLGFLTHTEIVNEYKFKFLFNNKPIDRATELPIKYIEIIKKFNFDIRTYGELAFINQMPNQEQLFDELKTLGFNSKILNEIK